MRKSGILMHVSSLPGRYGVGTMGKQAFAFVDFLKQSEQSVWQILPLNPTGYGDSPYQSCSTFAGNHYLIDLEQLVEQGLLTEEEIDTVEWNVTEDRVDFGKLYNHKLNVLKQAFARFQPDEEYYTFIRENGSWLSDYALYMALKQENAGKPWYEWDKELRERNAETLWKKRDELKDIISFQQFVQYLFYTQWNQLHAYATKNGIEIIGDVPIYVPWDSCDVWSNLELFQMDAEGNPSVVAGCPPDAFSDDGQLWGNPIYDWEAMEESGFSWWMRRLKAAGYLYDTVRLDHFRGFEAYWAIPFGDSTAKNGEWVKGPGMRFFDKVKEELPNLKIIAEDLGFLTPEVLEMRDESGYPGMKVLEFAFDDMDSNNYLPYTYTANSVCYIGTHDNMTLKQWLETAPETTVEFATEYMKLHEAEGINWGVIRTAMESVSDLCVIQMQDYLELGAEARMNFPGTLTSDNWTWRAKDGFATQELASRIAKLTKLYGRVNKVILEGEKKNEV